MKLLHGVCFLLRNPLSLSVFLNGILKANKKSFLFRCKYLPKINIWLRNYSVIFKNTFLAKTVKTSDHPRNKLITGAGGYRLECLRTLSLLSLKTCPQRQEQLVCFTDKWSFKKEWKTDPIVYRKGFHVPTQCIFQWVFFFPSDLWMCW